ncbi:MAG: hypothetical protein ACN6OQ_08700, partial [Paraburkholderia nemoris]
MTGLDAACTAETWLRHGYSGRRAAFCRQKNSLPAWTPVKYAKFFAERYVAQEIALFRTPQ